MGETWVKTREERISANTLSSYSGELENIAKSVGALERLLSRSGVANEAFRNNMSRIKQSLNDETVNVRMLSSALRNCMSIYERADNSARNALEGIAGVVTIPFPDASKFKSILLDLISRITILLATIGKIAAGGKDKNSKYVSDPVNVCTGNFISDSNEITFAGEFGLSFSRHYNSMYRNYGVMGLGWSHNYDISILEDENSIILCMGDQWRERFVSDDGRMFYSACGTLDYISKDNGYLCYLRYGSLYHFNEKKELVSIITKEKEALFFSYENGLLDKANDEAGRSIKYNYDEAGNLISIEDNIGRSVSMKYDDGLLVEVCAADNTINRYEYDKEKRLVKIINGRGNVSVINEYDESDRVTKQIFADESCITFEYMNNDVVVTERNGAKTKYSHNDKFEIKAVNTQKGTIEYEYDERGNRIGLKNSIGAVYKQKYDDKGNLICITDPCGGKISLSYVQEDNPNEVIDMNGGFSAIEYDEDGNVICYKDELGFETIFEYEGKNISQIIYPDGSFESFVNDDNGYLKCHYDECGNEWTYEYDAAGRKTKETNPKGASTLYEYDNMDRVICITNPIGDKQLFEYTETGKLKKRVDYDGKAEEWEYDVMGMPTKYVDKCHNITEYKYDKASNLIEIILPNKGVIKNEYDVYNRRIKEVAPDGQVITYVYDTEDRVIELNKNGVIKKYEYDLCDRIVKYEESGKTKSVTRDQAGQINEVTEADNVAYQYEYNEAGQCVTRSSSSGEVRHFQYDSRRRLSVITDNAGLKTTYEYYQNGNLKSVNYADSKIYYEYDACNNLIKKSNSDYSIEYKYDLLDRCVEMSDINGRCVQYEYDSIGNVIRHTDEEGNNKNFKYIDNKLVEAIDSTGQVTEYEYDSLDDLIKVKQSQSGYTDRLVGLNRNAAGNISQIIDSFGNEKKYEYDLNGNMVEYKNEAGEVTRYEYFKDGNVKTIEYDDGKKVEFMYDSYGRLIQYADWNGKTNLEYNSIGLLKAVSDFEGKTVNFEWDGNGRRTATVFPDGKKVSYSYNGNDRLSHITSKDIDLKYTYDKKGLLQRKDSGNGVYVEYAYYADGRIKEISYFDVNGLISKEEMQYDVRGNTLSKRISKRSSEDNYYEYTYDSENRITSVTKNGTLEKSFEYDPFGNRIKEINKGEEISFKYNELNQLTNKIISSEEGECSVSYDYDKLGRLRKQSSKDETIEYLYNSIGKLEKILKNGENITSYKYDGMGMRIEQVVDGKSTHLFNNPTKRYNNLISRSSNGEYVDVVYDGQIAAELNNNGYNIFQCNGQDSVVNYISIDGKVAESYDYDEFGNFLCDSINQPYGFMGQMYDKETGLILTNAREYSPQLGRFIQKDNYEFIHIKDSRSLNLYTYCFNNPLKYMDPTGNDCYYYYLPEWKGEAEKDRKALAKQYGYSEDKVHLIPIESNEGFESDWNNMGTVDGKKVDIDTVVINTHANPHELGGDNFSFDTNDAANLENKNMDQLLLYGCNAGHLDYKDENIANAFSRKTNGAPVMASDGTVYGRTLFGRYKSKGDKTFREYSELAGTNRKKNDGWQIYQEVDGKVKVTSAGKKNLRVRKMIDIIEDRRNKCQSGE